MKALRGKRKDSEQKSHLHLQHSYWLLPYKGIATPINTTTLRSDTMGRIYLDMAFTNGKYYLVDILEIAVVVEELKRISRYTETGAVADGDYK